MRILICLLGLISNPGWAASAFNSIDQLSSQVAPLWQSIKPSCVMALDLDSQQAVSSRLDWLDNKLVGRELTSHLASLSENKNTAWNDQTWAVREPLEQAALTVEAREPLREYFFKLQTQTPNPERAKLVKSVQFMSENINLTLKKELWKVCHALGFQAIPQEQLESAVHQRWLKQATKVKTQLNKELSAFYFYSFRQVPNTELYMLAKNADKLTPWVELTVASVEQYFQQLRTELLAVNFVLPQTSNTEENIFPDKQLFKPLSAPNQFSPK